MSILHAIILGIVQGLTEFLPLSSSGHLVLLEKVFGIEHNLIFLNVVLHLGTLFAVVIYYRKTLWKYLKNPFCKEVGWLVIATIPAVVLVLLFNDFIENTFGGSYLVIGFMITATVLVVSNLLLKTKRKQREFNYKSAIVMGICQGLAILPGISRSGSTITGGIAYGVDKEEAANFSFLMSIPIILASLVYEGIKLFSTPLNIGAVPLIFGFIFSFIFGFIAISLMLKLVKKASFYWFSIYLVILSILLLILGI